MQDWGEALDSRGFLIAPREEELPSRWRERDGLEMRW